MRIKALREAMIKKGIDAALIITDENIRYYSGFSGMSSELLVTPEQNYLFTDFRYTEQAEAETDFTVIETKGPARHAAIFEQAKRSGKKLGLDLSGVSYTSYKALLQHIDETDIVDISNVIEAQRAIKDEEELALIAKGARHNDALFSHLCKLIRAGMTEMDIKAEIVYYMNKNGAEIAFAPIVASGPNSSLPHATPTNRKIAPGDFVTMDYGCRFGGYCSDFTRTVGILDIDKEQQKVYDIVKCAGDMALEMLKAGLAAREADATARGYIAQHGYADAFGHGLGHGVGLFIHEAPSLNEVSKATLSDGMVVTVEPGIYLKGRFGVRIEDLCVIKDGGSVNLTAAPRDLIIL
jgi:Xaa-Pro aminopeptidase